jgi:sigma-B regulation protein RsbU (phosphoserine phosphatase)
LDAVALAQADTHMQCMEVWGGNTPVDNGVSMLGLDAWVYSRPFQSAEAGGDVYYVSSCATGRITRLLVADVSGHGNAVKEIAGTLRTLMRRYVNHLDQRQFVRSMNKQFTELSAAGCFATAVVTTFFGPTNYLTLCNAGHPTPLIYRAKSRTWSLLERTTSSGEEIANIPLGIEDIADYEQIAVQLNVNDLVLCYSDSLIESHGASGQMLGEEGLLRIAREIDGSNPATVVPTLMEKIRALAPTNLEGDDVTVLLFRPNGTAPTLTLREKLIAPVRVCGGVIRSLLPGGGPPPLPDMSVPNIGGALFTRLNRFWKGHRA